MRELSLEQELALLRDQVFKIRAAGCPETYRLPERAWLLVHQALVIATSAAGTDALRDAAVVTHETQLPQFH